MGIVLPDWHLHLFAALGAFVLYCKLRSEGRRVIQFLPVIAPHWNSSLLPLIEAFIFSGIGGIVSVALLQPSTMPQALSAGLGWTGLLTAISKGK
jgi:hypothetical protein